MLTNIKCVIKETGSKVGCFGGFCHHPVTTTSAHAFHYPLFKCETKTNPRTIALCRKDIKLIIFYVTTKNNSKVDFLTTIIDVLLAKLSDN